MSLGWMDCTNVTVFVIRALRSANIFSVSSCFGTSTGFNAVSPEG